MEKITGLQEIVTLASNDVFPVVDVSLGENGNCKISLENLLNAIASALPEKVSNTWSGLNKTGSTLADLENRNGTDLVASQGNILLGRPSSGGGSILEIACSAFGRTLINSSGSDVFRASIGLGSMSMRDSVNVAEDISIPDLKTALGLGDLAYKDSTDSNLTIDIDALKESLDLGELAYKDTIDPRAMDLGDLAFLDRITGYGDVDLPNLRNALGLKGLAFKDGLNTSDYNIDNLKTALGLGSMAYQSSDDILVTGGALSGVSTDGLSTSGGGGASWQEISHSDYNDIPVSGAKILVSNTYSLKKGLPVRYIFDDKVFYGIITEVDENNFIEIDGIPFDTQIPIQHIYYGSPTRVIQRVFNFGGQYGAIVSNLLDPVLPWPGSSAILVSMAVCHRSNDATAQPRVNMKINGEFVFDGGGIAVIDDWQRTNPDNLNPDYYDINFAEELEIWVTSQGVTGNAEDLKVIATFIDEPLYAGIDVPIIAPPDPEDPIPDDPEDPDPGEPDPDEPEKPAPNEDDPPIEDEDWIPTEPDYTGEQYVYLLGGKSYSWNGYEITERCEEYWPSTNTWTEKNDIPSPNRFGAAAAGINGTIYVMGGRAKVGDYDEMLFLTETIAMTSNTWVTKSMMPSPSRSEMGCTELGNAIMLFGGSTFSRDTDQYEIVDTWITRQDMLWPGRTQVATANIGVTAAIFGGDPINHSRMFADADEYRQNIWTNIGEVPNRNYSKYGISQVSRDQSRIMTKHMALSMGSTAYIFGVDPIKHRDNWYHRYVDRSLYTWSVGTMGVAGEWPMGTYGTEAYIGGMPMNQCGASRKLGDGASRGYIFNGDRTVEFNPMAFVRKMDIPYEGRLDACAATVGNPWQDRPGPDIILEQFANPTVSGVLFGGYAAGAVADCDEFDAAKDTWSNIYDLTSARYGACAATIGAGAYLFGGKNTNALNLVEQYLSSGWITEQELPEPARYGSVCFVIDSKAHIIGGQDSFDTMINDNDRFDKEVWVSRTNMLAPLRSYFTGVSIYSDGYIFGGNDGATRIADTDLYSRDVWTNMIDLPDPGRDKFAATGANDCAYIFGGESGVAMLQTCQRYDRGTWTTRTEMPVPGRCELTAGLINGNHYIFGGTDGTDRLDDTEEYCLGTWTAMTPMMSPARSSSGSSTLNVYEYVPDSFQTYVFGDDAEAFGRLCSEYMFADDTWIQRTQAPEPARGSSAAASVGAYAYLISGIGNGGFFANCDAYTRDFWVSHTDVPLPARAFASAEELNNEIFVFGGFDGSALADCDSYNPATRVWTSKANLINQLRTHHSSAKIGDFAYLFGGHDGFALITSSEQYVPDTWITRLAMPVPGREMFASCSASDHAILMGGSDRSEYPATCLEYVLDTWEETEDMPLPGRIFNSATMSGENYDAAYSFGGLDIEGHALQLVEAYESGIFTTKSPMPATGRVSSCASTVFRYGYFPDAGGMEFTYLVGSDTGGTKIQDTDEFAPDTWISKTDMPIPARAEIGTCNIYEEAYVFGGDDGASCLNVCDCYTPKSDAWTTKTDLPAPDRTLSVSESVADRAYVIGGIQQDTTALQDLDEYRSHIDSWITRDSMTTIGRGNAAGASLNHDLHTFGGENLTTMLGNTDKYDPRQLSWTNMGDMPTARTAACASNIYDSAFVQSGAISAEDGATYDTVLNTNEQYVPNTWVDKADVPAPTRIDSGSASITGESYLFGGRGTKGNDPDPNQELSTLSALTDTMAYKYQTNLWEVKVDIPGAGRSKMGATTVATANTLPETMRHRFGHLFGGTGIGGACEQYDNLSDVWAHNTENTSAMDNPISGQLGNSAFVFGNSVAGQHTDEFMLNTWSMRLDVPYPRRKDSATASVNGSIYLAGGKMTDSNDHIADCDAYAPDVWVAQTNMPDPFRYDHTGCGLGMNAYFFAGRNNSGYAPEALEYLVSLETWQVLTDMPYPMHITQATAIRNAAYLFGGSDSTEVDKFTTGLWTALMDMPLPTRKDGTCTTIGESGYYWGGTTTYTTWEYVWVNMQQIKKYTSHTDSTLFNDEFTLGTWTGKSQIPSPSRIKSSSECIDYLPSFVLPDNSPAIYPEGYEPERMDPTGANYFFAGYSEIGKTKDTSEYIPDTWISRTNMLDPARVSAASTGLGSYGYIFGGNIGISNVDQYAVDVWSNTTDLPSPGRKAFTAEALGVDIFVSAGKSDTELILNDHDSLAANTWTVRNYVPAPLRFGQTSAVVDNVLYLFGGDSANSITLRDVLSYTVDTWITKSDLPTDEHTWASAGVIGSKAFIFSGQKCEEYIPIVDAWVIKKSMPTVSQESAAASNSNAIVLAGGFNGNYMTDCFAYIDDNDLWITRTGLPTQGRYLLSACSILGIPSDHDIDDPDPSEVPSPETPFNPGDYILPEIPDVTDWVLRDGIYLFGGLGLYDGEQNPTTLSDVDSYSNNVWVSETDMPTDRKGDAAASVGASTYLFGTNWETLKYAHNTWFMCNNFPREHSYRALGCSIGENVFSFSGTVTSFQTKEYNPASDMWRSRAEIPGPPRYYSGVFTIGETAYIAGGYDGGQALNDCDAYTFDVWVNRGDLPSPGRYGVSASSLDNLGYVIGGASRDDEYNVVHFDNNDEYDPTSNSWVSRAIVPIPARSYGGAAALTDSVFMISGTFDQQNYDRLFNTDRYNPLLDTWFNMSDIISPPREQFAITQMECLHTVGDGWESPLTFSEVPPTEVQGSTYIFGGFSTNCISDCDGFLNNIWRSMTDVPLPTRRDVAGTKIGSSAIMFGGYTSAGYHSPATEQYCPDTWVNRTNMVWPGRRELDAATLIETAYTFGGSESGYELHDTDAYDPDVWTTMLNMPNPARAGMSATEHGSAIFIAGGVTGDDYELQEFDAYEPDVWVSKPYLPSPARRNPGIASQGGAIYLFGGYTNGGPAPNCERFYVDTWQRLTDFPYSTLTHKWETAVIDNEIYLFAGSTAGNDTGASNNCYKYNHSTLSWTVLTTMPYPKRHSHAAVLA